MIELIRDSKKLSNFNCVIYQHELNNFLRDEPQNLPGLRNNDLTIEFIHKKLKEYPKVDYVKIWEKAKEMGIVNTNIHEPNTLQEWQDSKIQSNTKWIYGKNQNKLELLDGKYSKLYESDLWIARPKRITQFLEGYDRYEMHKRSHLYVPAKIKGFKLYREYPEDDVELYYKIEYDLRQLKIWLEEEVFLYTGLFNDKPLSKGILPKIEDVEIHYITERDLLNYPLFHEKYYMEGKYSSGWSDAMLDETIGEILRQGGKPEEKMRENIKKYWLLQPPPKDSSPWADYDNMVHYLDDQSQPVIREGHSVHVLDKVDGSYGERGEVISVKNISEQGWFVEVRIYKTRVVVKVRPRQLKIRRFFKYIMPGAILKATLKKVEKDAIKAEVDMLYDDSDSEGLFDERLNMTPYAATRRAWERKKISLTNPFGPVTCCDDKNKVNAPGFYNQKLKEGKDGKNKLRAWIKHASKTQMEIINAFAEDKDKFINKENENLSEEQKKQIYDNSVDVEKKEDELKSEIDEVINKINNFTQPDSLTYNNTERTEEEINERIQTHIQAHRRDVVFRAEKVADDAVAAAAAAAQQMTQQLEEAKAASAEGVFRESLDDPMDYEEEIRLPQPQEQPPTKRPRTKKGGKKLTRRRVKKSSKKKLGYKLINTRKQK